MAELQLESKLCLNDIAVPLVNKQMDLWDSHKVLPEDEEEGEDQAFDLLNLKATSKSEWLEKAFKLPARWWVLNQSRVPLLQEIRKVIEGNKKAKAKVKSLEEFVAARANVVVAIRIRDQVILVVNDARSVTLAFRSGQVEDSLLWFLKELQKDVREIQNVCSSSRKRQPEAPPDQKKQIIEDVLENLQQHPSCRSAVFLPSRGAIKVNNKEFRILNLNKKSKEALDQDDLAGWENLKTEFLKAAEHASQFLDEAPRATPKSSSSSSKQRSEKEEQEDEEGEGDEEDEQKEG